MDAVSALALSELERLKDVQSMTVYGSLSPELTQALPVPAQEYETAALLRDVSAMNTPADYVVYLHDADLTALESRAVAHRLAAVTGRVLLVVTPLGAELPVPLIEVKRGLLLNSGRQGYRVLGRRA